MSSTVVSLADKSIFAASGSIEVFTFLLVDLSPVLTSGDFKATLTGAGVLAVVSGALQPATRLTAARETITVYATDVRGFILVFILTQAQPNQLKEDS